jgi:E3 ubiquitin-protein ligase RNF31
MESFTMSVDRGFLGHNPEKDLASQYRSMDDLSAQKNKGMELVRMLRDAEKGGFTPEDLQVGLNHCGENNPVMWLKDNLGNMVDTVVTLASNVGHETEQNTIGEISRSEGKEALRKHKGNVWAAVTECVEGRRAKVGTICAYILRHN